ncbi:MAG TPA: response regulator [Flavisolibacter sp.]|nr:response regulator [Flavisolibacter sp.]
MFKRTRVLVVDSDLHNLSRIYLSLIHKGYKVEASEDGQEIIPRTERFKPSIIIIHELTRNLSAEVYSFLQQCRKNIILVKETEAPRPFSSYRLQVVTMPADINFFDRKIREILGIVD